MHAVNNVPQSILKCVAKVDLHTIWLVTSQSLSQSSVCVRVFSAGLWAHSGWELNAYGHTILVAIIAGWHHISFFCICMLIAINFVDNIMCSFDHCEKKSCHSNHATHFLFLCESFIKRQNTNFRVTYRCHHARGKLCCFAMPLVKCLQNPIATHFEIDCGTLLTACINDCDMPFYSWIPKGILQTMKFWPIYFYGCENSVYFGQSYFCEYV